MEEQGSEEDINKLLVFGYECKIFRDDEKAKWVESEKHLIPCMSDPSVLVDRYDCRGALMDVRSYEPRPKDSDYLNELSPMEVEVERICEEERFRDCQNEEYDDTEYQEEEFKRLQMAIGDGGEKNEKINNYSAMGYSYGTASDPATKPPEIQTMGPIPSLKKKSKDAPYVQPLGLYIPHDLVLPRTMKSHAIIEKTAKFIGSHGTQMEIILKTKQANNPQFNFLNYSDELNPYYKYLVTAIRTNAYKPMEMACPDDSSPDENEESGDEPGSPEHNGSYLHPSLVNKPTSESASLIPTSAYNYKPTAHSSYSMLVSKIQEVTYTAAVESPPPQVPYGQNPDLNSAFDLPYAQGGKDYGMSDALGGQHFGDGGPGTLMPPPDDLIIIEKMANYVIKNGPAFELLATTKGDPRFRFLDSRSPYHWYYVCCKEHFRMESSAVVASDTFVAYSDGQRKDIAKEEVRVESKPKSSSPQLTARVRPTHSTQNVVPAPSNIFDQPPKSLQPNHANAVTRMSTLPPELITKIEELRKRTLLRKQKESGGSQESLSPEFDMSPALVSGCEPAGPPALQTKKENVIKFSASISHKFRAEDDVSDRLEFGVSSNGGGAVQDDEASRLRKEERRRKAALFLERLKANNAGKSVEVSHGPEVVTLSPDSTVTPSGPLKESQPEATQPVPPLNRLLALKREAEQEDKERQRHAQDFMPSESKKHRSRRRTHHSSSTEESSLKDDRPSSSKKKKSKHSKKKKKKDEKHHSHSHSKKSKKKRH